MKALFSLLTLLLSYSCTKYSSLSKEAVGLNLKDIKMEVSHLQEIEWHVGMKNESTLTQSIVFLIDMPKVKEEDLEFLTKDRGVDAWILRLVVNRGGKGQDLGAVYSPFKTHKILRGKDTAGTAGSVSFKLYYAAAYASERFRGFKCPALGHRKKVEKMTIRGSTDSFDLSINQSIAYNEKPQMAELTPSSFNGGLSLVGDYNIEIAAYNSKTKTIYSGFKALPQYIEISREEEVPIKSCEGIHSEVE